MFFQAHHIRGLSLGFHPLPSEGVNEPRCSILWLHWLLPLDYLDVNQQRLPVFLEHCESTLGFYDAGP